MQEGPTRGLLCDKRCLAHYPLGALLAGLNQGEKALTDVAGGQWCSRWEAGQASPGPA
jgi:hypothetical protein